MDMDAERPLPQPDFRLAAHSFREISVQLERCQNLPAVDGGARLVEVLDTVAERMMNMERLMTRRFDSLDQKVDALSRRMDVT